MFYLQRLPESTIRCSGHRQSLRMILIPADLEKLLREYQCPRTTSVVDGRAGRIAPRQGLMNLTAAGSQRQGPLQTPDRRFAFPCGQLGEPLTIDHQSLLLRGRFYGRVLFGSLMKLTQPHQAVGETETRTQKEQSPAVPAPEPAPGSEEATPPHVVVEPENNRGESENKQVMEEK